MARTQIGADEILDGSITDADVASAAAISGSKVSPAFGSQNLSATGHLSLAGISAPSGQSGAVRMYFDSGTNKLRVSENNGAFVDLIGSTVSGTGSSGRVAFWSGANSISSDSNLFWDNTSKLLGIDNSAPAYNLDVTGNIRATSSIFGQQFDASSGGGGNTTNPLFKVATATGMYYRSGSLSFTHSDNLIADWNPGTYAFYAAPAGDVAIRLQTNSTGAGIKFINASSVQKGQLAWYSNAGDVLMDAASMIWRPADGSTTWMNLANGPLLGIGSGTPESSLDVQSTSDKWSRFGKDAWSMRLGSLSGGNQWIGLGVNKTAADNTYQARTGNNAAVNHLIMEMAYPNANGGFNFYGQTHVADGTTLSQSLIMHLDVNGNVGIGSGSPTFGLQVHKDNGSGWASFFSKSSSAAGVLLGTSTIGTQASIQGLTNFNGSVDTLAINPVGGNVIVGGGATAPTAQFAVGANTFQVSSSGDLVKIKGVTLSWPASNAVGTLTNDGSGNLSWAAATGGAGPTWTKYTANKNSFSAAATTNSITLFTLPAQGVIHKVVIKHSQAFSGAGITAYTVSLGISTNKVKYASAFDVFQAVSSSTAQLTDAFNMEDFTSGTAILATATSTGANLSAAGTGSVDIWVLASTLP